MALSYSSIVPRLFLDCSSIVPRLFRLFGLAPDQAVAGFEAWGMALHADDRVLTKPPHQKNVRCAHSSAKR